MTFIFFNQFVPNASFLYPLKTSENLKVFWCFRGVEKDCIGNEWVNEAAIEKMVSGKSMLIMNRILNTTSTFSKKY